MRVGLYVSVLYMQVIPKMSQFIRHEKNESGNNLTNDELIGGGEILQADINSKFKHEFFDEGVMAQFQSLPYVKIVICILLAILAIKVIVRWYRVRSLILSDSLSTVIGNDKKLKKRDKKILRTEKRISKLNKTVNSIGFGLSAAKEEYISYNLRRANVRVSGKDRYMTASEFNACVKACVFTWLFLMLVISVFFSTALGLAGGICGAVLINTLPLTIIKFQVEEKEAVIRGEFPNLYVNIHAAIKGKGDIKFIDVFKDYRTTTDTEEMLRFIDTCLDLMNEVGEYEATTRIMKEFKEIAEIKTTMRLLRQYQSGADVDKEVDGLKDSLLERQEDAINTKGDKLVDKATRSLIWIMVILVQVLITAMLPYLKDIVSFQGLF